MAHPVGTVSRGSDSVEETEAMQADPKRKNSEAARVRLAVALMVASWVVALAWLAWGIALVLVGEQEPESSACQEQEQEQGPEF